MRNNTVECKIISSFARSEPNPSLDNLAIGLSHKSYAFWGTGLDGYSLLRWDFKEWDCCKREEKDGLLVHAFFAMFTLFSFISFFLFSLLFLFQFSLFLDLVTISHSIYGYCSYLYWF